MNGLVKGDDGVCCMKVTCFCGVGGCYSIYLC